MSAIKIKKALKNKTIRMRVYDACTTNSEIVRAEVLDPQGGKSGDKISLARSLRDDPLGWMHSHKTLTDTQYLAGRTIQQLFYARGLGGVSAVDTTRPYIDGGVSGGNIDRRIAASQKLEKIYAAVGSDGSAWLQAILYQSLNIKEACAQRGEYLDKHHRAASKIIKSHLDTASQILGIATESRFSVRLHPFGGLSSLAA